ncbi:TRAP transporter small permease subunit [Ferrimonas balearica]|uniref:TRAP transporter small permease subunit n=1 Tax=Ferrimonas balearica TaxID=44012 RepID=UPI001F21EA91|nr:TRAP transporter small permease subunit [Ferrimonas balearica]MBY6018098.1 TRAP transporter small permease subunit [Halomonas denitrificans]MBY6094437.1 TRAP transporter small permease subunit [Ferrimonas balearica]
MSSFTLSWIDRLSEWLGRLCGLLMLAMLLLATAVVALRYGMESGSIALQESVLYLHGALFTLGAGFTLKHNGHVRVDIFYRNWSARRRAWVDLLGTLLLLLPLIGFIGWQSWPYVMASWARLEGSPEAGGLALVYLQKTLLLGLVLTLGLQALAELARAVATLRREAPV